MKKIVAATQYYKDFVKTLDAKVVPDVGAVSVSKCSDAVETEVVEAVQSVESPSSENAREDNTLKIDFSHIDSFAYTKPVSFAYFGEEQVVVSNWTQLYEKVLVYLSEDYPNKFLQMLNTNISGGQRIDFGTPKASEAMKAPKKVSENFYVETNLSATDIVLKIRTLLDRCNVDYENLEIYYIKLELPQQEKPAREKDAPVSLPALKNGLSVTANHLDPAVAFLDGKQLKYIDCREKNGCLWIVGGAEIKDVVRPLIDAGVSLHFKEEGGNVTGGRPAWWTKEETSHIHLAEDTSALAGHARRPVTSSAATSASGDEKEQFRSWLMHDQHMAEGSAQSYSSAITNCEQMASRLGLSEAQLYGADCTTAQRIVDQLMQTDEYRAASTSQHNRYSAAITKYLLYLRRADWQEADAAGASIEKETEQKIAAFDKFFASEKYELLYQELKKNGIATLDALKGINLWSFMNLHQLYSIQQRQAISMELIAKLQDAGKADDEQGKSTYEIHYNGAVYKGVSPSAAFVAFLTAVAAKYPLKFRSLLGVMHPKTGQIAISRYFGDTKLKMMNPEAYVDSDLSSEQVQLYTAWVLERCGAASQEYSIKENENDAEAPIENLQQEAEQSAETPVPKPAAADHDLMQKAEDYLLQCDLEGATYGALQGELQYTMVGTKEIVAQSPRILEMNKRLYHEDALVDFEEGADAIEGILERLLKKYDGIATAKLLYEHARSEMPMFFNDNGIADQRAVYDLARHLFEKLEYHGKRYIFRSNIISCPEVSVDSHIDIMRKYAREKNATVTFTEMESYLAELGLNTGNLRAKMLIDKEPVFLIYAENEYLLAELMHVDDAFLQTIHSALRRLFADCDGHIIPRSISDGWYYLLPALPASLSWTPMLLQQMIRFYPDELGARTIHAMKSQSSNTLHAMFVEKESWIQDFRDAVAVFLNDEMPNCSEFEAEELRAILVDAGMISGNELISNMHNALGGDARFLWNSEGSHVKVRI